jgi:hypothetical protein
MTIQPIVEGHGEVEAVPILLRRLRDLALTYPLDVNAPIRRHYTDFFDETELRKAVRLALKQPCDGILFIVMRAMAETRLAATIHPPRA